MTGTDVSKMKEKLEEFRKNKPLMFRQLKEICQKTKAYKKKYKLNLNYLRKIWSN